MEKPTFIVYALYSPDYEKIYIGYSSDFEKRLISHNEKATKGWTIRYRPWRVVFTEEFSTQKEACKGVLCQSHPIAAKPSISSSVKLTIGSLGRGAFPPAFLLTIPRLKEFKMTIFELFIRICSW